MPWRRLNPAAVAEQLRAQCEPADEAVAEQALAHLRAALLSGMYIAVEEDKTGQTLVGTEAEAAEYMLAQAEN